jgi:hypothetical protein
MIKLKELLPEISLMSGDAGSDRLKDIFDVAFRNGMLPKKYRTLFWAGEDEAKNIPREYIGKNLTSKDKKEIELTTEEKIAFQETMNDFVSEVSDLSDFGILNMYENSVEWSGKVIDFDLEFFYTIGENNGVYINGDMIKLDDKLVELVNKLTTFYEQFKTKWAKIVSSRKKTKMKEE